MRGRIVRAIAGFYFVQCGPAVYACHGAGILRRLGVKPLVGDEVVFDVTHEEDREGNITALLPRTSSLTRPAVANVDLVLLVTALHSPEISFLTLDKLLIALERLMLTPLVFLNKCDLDKGGEAAWIERIYREAGYELIAGSAYSEETLTLLRQRLHSHTTALAGASGVGKSTLINRLLDKEAMMVGDISKRSGRGRQTTRHTELFGLDEQSFICDTPGFSLLEIEGIGSSALKEYFREFDAYSPSCRYTDCSHIAESPDICAVRRAVDLGLIASSRYASYRRLFHELKEKEQYV